MIVVSDTSVVTALIQIGRVNLLLELFGDVVIPQAVADELVIYHLPLPPWIRTICVRESLVVETLRLELDAGESEAIALAIELGAEFLLMDEKLGRAAAKRAGLTTIGVLGVAIAAKRQGLLDHVAEVIHELKEVASFWISAELEARVLSDAGEL